VSLRRRGLFLTYAPIEEMISVELRLHEKHRDAIEAAFSTRKRRLIPERLLV